MYLGTVLDYGSGAEFGPQPPNTSLMSIIQEGAKAPGFKLASHLDEDVDLASFHGKKNVMLVFYPLDFTPT